MRILHVAPAPATQRFEGGIRRLREDGVDVSTAERLPSRFALFFLRMAGVAILHLDGTPAEVRPFARLAAACRFLGVRVVWSTDGILPEAPRATDVEDLRRIFRSARLRIVATQDQKERLEADMGLKGSTLVIPLDTDARRMADALRLAYETALEPRYAHEDRARPA